MKIKNIILAILSFILIVSACQKEYNNPEFNSDEIYVYLYGAGNKLSWQEYNVTVGDSLELRLQVAPADAQTKWVLNDKEVSTSLEYTYHAKQEGNEKLYFIASRPDVVDTVTFSINTVLDGEVSKLNEWQAFPLEQEQTGKFIAEFDMVASMDSIDAVTGFLSGIPTGFGDLSCIIRFTKEGVLDARNGGAYEKDTDIKYTAGQNMHVRMEINVGTNLYDVFVTPAGGTEIQLAKDYAFRKSNINLDYWAIIYGDWMPVNIGSHRVSNMKITTITQNEAPILAPLEDIGMVGGAVKEVEVSASDPLGEGVSFETNDLPRFATFVDNGDGTGIFTFKPYGECGGCDNGEYSIIVKAINRLHTTADTFIVKVADVLSVVSDINDAHIYEIPRLVDPYQTQLVAGKMDPSWLADYQDTASNLAIVLPFLMPEIPEGTVIAGAELKLEIAASTSWDPYTKYDLYGINARDNSTVLGTDFFRGPYDTDTNPEVTAIEGAIMSGDQAVGVGAYGSTGLPDFLNTQVQNGATGKYIFLRINGNRIDQPTWSVIKVLSANDDTGGLKPTLIIYLAPAK